MSPDYHIAAEDGLISIQVRSHITLVDLYELARAVLEDPEYDPSLPLLADLREMRLELKPEAAAPFSRFVIANFREREGMMAVVIDSDMSRELSAGVYWLACAVSSAEVFDDYDHALKWLIKKEFASEPVDQRAAGC